MRKWTWCWVIGVALLFSCAGLASAQEDGDGIMPPLPQSVFDADGEPVKVKDASDVGRTNPGNAGAKRDDFALPAPVRIQEEPSPVTESRTDAEPRTASGVQADEGEALTVKANRSRVDKPSTATPKVTAENSERQKNAADNGGQPSPVEDEDEHNASSAGVRGGQFGKPFRVSHGASEVRSAYHDDEADDEEETSSFPASPVPSDNQVVKVTPAVGPADKDEEKVDSAADHKDAHHMKGSSIQPRGGNVRAHQAKPKPSRPDNGIVAASKELPKVKPSTPVSVTRESISDIVGEELRATR